MARLYWSARSLPAEDAVEGLRAYLDASLSREANRPYLDALMGYGARRPPLPRVLTARLCGLSLLPPLLERAGVDPAGVRLYRDQHGRPHGDVIDGGLSFDFNISHSDGHAACALLMGDGTVGLDVEELLPPKRALPLIGHYCTEGELSLLEGLNDGEKAAAFTRLWTVREALAKQDGRGMPLRYDGAIIPHLVKVFCGVFPEVETRVSLCVPREVDLTDVIAVPPAPPMDWEEWTPKQTKKGVVLG